MYNYFANNGSNDPFCPYYCAQSTSTPTNWEAQRRRPSSKMVRRGDQEEASHAGLDLRSSTAKPLLGVSPVSVLCQQKKRFQVLHRDELINTASRVKKISEDSSDDSGFLSMSKPNTSIPDCDGENDSIPLSVLPSGDSIFQELLQRAQSIHGHTPAYSMIRNSAEFQEQGIITIRVRVGEYSTCGKGKRRKNAIISAAREMLKTLETIPQNIPDLLERFASNSIDQFVLKTKLLIDLEEAACAGLLKKEKVEISERLEVAETSNTVYGGTLVKLWTSGIMPEVRVGSNVSLQGWEQQMIGIVTSVDEAQVCLSVRESKLVFTLVTDFILERMDCHREFQKLKVAVENANNPTKHFENLRDVLFGLKEPEVAPFLLPLKYFNPQLDKTQKASVNFSLRQEELTVIHGPPGTGKTTAVVEIILQTLLTGGKVLVCSPSNVAVDNIMERLLTFRQEKEKFIRIGNPARVSEGLQKFTLDAVTQEKSRQVEDVQMQISVIQAELDKSSDGVTGERLELWRKSDQLKQDLKHMTEDLHNTREKALVNAEVVLGTLTSCDPEGTLKLLPQFHFSLTVIDEVAQALEAACWLVIPRAPRLLVAGDHLQLPPTIHSQNKEVKDQLSVTLMERLLDRYARWDMKVVFMLDIQYRMNRKIMQWSSDTFYHGGLYASPSVENHTLAQLSHVRLVPGLTDTVLLLIDTAGCNMGEVASGEKTSFANVGEARIVCHLVKQLMESGLRAEEVGVITTYSRQVELLANNLHSQYNELEIKTVDGFQGREKECIILSLVRSNPACNIGFLVEKRRLNVAVTRARRQLILVCDSNTVARDVFIQNFLAFMKHEGRQQSPHDIVSLTEIRVAPGFQENNKSMSTVRETRPGVLLEIGTAMRVMDIGQNPKSVGEKKERRL
eukprot:GFUD01026687.1.p1 GENE.GFUD01026687.1~~GFUD01026687.1.p1  ORF type:complete len:903 (+),score=241.20 GFUD01026687.1:48-2756(+)